MFRIARQFVWHKKRSSFLLLLIVALSLALMLSIGPMFDSARESIFEAYAGRYGLQHGAIFYLDAQKITRLEAKKGEGELEYGLFSNYGQWQLEQTGHALTLGWFSEEAVRLGMLQLQEGRFPEAEDELVLEQNVVKYKCPQGTQVGDTLTFVQNGERKQCKLVGILADYVGNWESFSEDSLIEGINDFPRGLLGKQSAARQETQGALLYFYRYDPIRDGERLLPLSRELNQTKDFTYDYVRNDQLYLQVEETIMQPFRSFRLLMITVVMVGGALIMFVSAGLYLARFKESYYTMYILGSGKGKVGTVYAGQCTMLLLSGAILGLVCAQCIAWLYGVASGNHLSVFSVHNLLWPGAALLVMAGFMALAFRFGIAPLLKQSLSERKLSGGGKETAISRNLLFSLTGSFINRNFRRVILVLLVVAILVSAVGIAKVYEKQFEMPQKYDIAFHLSASSAFAGLSVYPFEISNLKNNLFPISCMEELQSMEGILNLTVMQIADASMIIPVERSPYWGRFVEADYTAIYGGDGFYAEKVAGAPTTGVTVLTKLINNYEIVVLTEENLKEYLKTYPDLPIESMLEKQGIALILPPIGEEKQGELSMEDIQAGILPGQREAVHYDTLQVGDMLRFGRMEYAEDVLFSEIWQDISLLQYQELEYEILYISEEVIQIYRGFDTYETNKPTVLIMQETNEQTNLIKGLYSILITTQGDISEEAYCALEAKVQEIALANPGSVVYSAREEREQNQKLMRLVNLSLSMILSVFGLFTVIAIYSALYMTILQRRRSLAIYRALGLRRRTLTLAMLLELLFYWLVAILGAFVIGLGIFHFTWHISNVPYMAAPLIRTLLIALAAGLPLNGAIVWSLQRGIYRQSVYEAMRFGE